MKIKKGVMTSADENSSAVIPFFPYTMEDCIVSKVTENEVKKVVVNPTDISDSGASVGRVTASVDNGKVIYRPNGEHRLILKISHKVDDGFRLSPTDNENDKTFDLNVTLPVNVDIDHIIHISTSGVINNLENGSAIVTGVGYRLYDDGTSHHLVIGGTITMSNISIEDLVDHFILMVTVDYM